MLTGQAPPNNIEWNLFALPPWWGLGLCNPVCLASQEFDVSHTCTITALLLHHDHHYPEVKADRL